MSNVDIRIYFWNVDNHQIKDIDYQNLFSYHKNSDYKIEIIEKKWLVLAHRYPLNYRDKNATFLFCGKDI